MSMAVKTLTFNQALQKAANLGKKKQLLLGNGFSIGCDPVFKYQSLFEEAKARKIPKHLIKLLDRHQSHFEEALKALDEGIFLSNLYKLVTSNRTPGDMNKDYEALKQLLSETISSKHPDYPSQIDEDQFISCHNFLSNFDAIFTVSWISSAAKMTQSILTAHLAIQVGPTNRTFSSCMAHYICIPKGAWSGKEYGTQQTFQS